MFNSIRKDKNRRDLVKKFEIQRLQNKVLFQATSALESRVSLNVTLINNNFVFVKNRQKQVELRKKVLQSKSVNNTPNDFFFQALQNNSVFQNNTDCQKKIFKETPRNSSKNRVQNRCIETGRSRAVLRFCKLSRICLRDKASKGLISGVSKASW